MVYKERPIGITYRAAYRLWCKVYQPKDARRKADILRLQTLQMIYKDSKPKKNNLSGISKNIGTESEYFEIVFSKQKTILA